MFYAKYGVFSYSIAHANSTYLASAIIHCPVARRSFSLQCRKFINFLLENLNSSRNLVFLKKVYYTRFKFNNLYYYVESALKIREFIVNI